MINTENKADFVSFKAVRVEAVALINSKIFMDLSYSNNITHKILNIKDNIFAIYQFSIVKIDF